MHPDARIILLLVLVYSPPSLSWRALSWTAALRTLATREFAESIWEQRPHLVRHAANSKGDQFMPKLYKALRIGAVDAGFFTDWSYKAAFAIHNTMETRKPISIGDFERMTAFYNSTYALNRAGLIFVDVAESCFRASTLFGLPANINTYVTRLGTRRIGVPAHNDRQVRSISGTCTLTESLFFAGCDSDAS